MMSPSVLLGLSGNNVSISDSSFGVFMDDAVTATARLPAVSCRVITAFQSSLLGFCFFIKRSNS